MTAKIDGTNGVLQQYDYQTPTTGFSYTFAAGTTVLVMNPAGTLATGTITMPASPTDGMTISFSSTQQITALTVNGNTGQSIVGEPTTILSGGASTFVYRLSNTTWYAQTNTAGLGVTTTGKIQPITASVAANALTVTLKPTTLDFRSSTLGSGTVNTRIISSAISMTVSSGSTLGTVNATASRIVVLAIDNAGTVELAVVNIAGGNQLDETNLISTTAEGGAGAADSNNVIYSTTARSSVPYRIVGFVDSTQTTAGTWATAPSTIQGVGGQALAAMSSLGYGQTWQTVTRSLGTTYYNTTGKPISGYVQLSGSGLTLTINGVALLTTGATNTPPFVTFIVPTNHTYQLSGSVGLSTWFELR